MRSTSRNESKCLHKMFLVLLKYICNALKSTRSSRTGCTTVCLNWNTYIKAHAAINSAFHNLVCFSNYYTTVDCRVGIPVYCQTWEEISRKL